MQANAPLGEVVRNPSQDAPWRSPPAVAVNHGRASKQGTSTPALFFFFLGVASEGLDTTAEAAAFTRGTRAYSIATSADPEAEAATKQGIGDNDQ